MSESLNRGRMGEYVQRSEWPRFATAFGRALKEGRARGRITQEELAFRAGIDRTYPSLMERGIRQPSLTVLVAVARALEIQPVQLLAETLAQLREE